MSRSRVFNCYRNVQNPEEGYLWVDENLHENEDIKWYRAQLEEGFNGRLHIQAVWGYANARTLKSVTESFQEPTIQLTKNPQNMYQYCTNEDKRYPRTNLMMKGDFKPREDKKKWDENMKIAVATGDFTKAMKHMKEHHLRYYVNNKKQLAAHLLEELPRQDVVQYTLDQFTEPPIPNEILFTKTVVLVGKSSYGKTCYAMAHFKNPAVIRSRCDYSKITPETDGIVFDDMEMCNWNTSTVKNLVDLAFQGNHDVKYGHVHIRLGTPRIICTNIENDFWPKSLFDAAGDVAIGQVDNHDGIRRKVVVKICEKPLFNKTIEDCEKEYEACGTRLGLGVPNTYTMRNDVVQFSRFKPY